MSDTEYQSLRRVDEETGITLKIIADGDPESPLNDEGDSVIFAVYHNRRQNPADRHGLGEVEAGKAFEQANQGDDSEYVVFPLYAYEHGNILFKAGASNPFSCPWDSGQAGFIALKRSAFSGDLLKTANGIAETYSDWCNGNVWGYVVEDADENHRDSCWGYYGDPDESGCFAEGFIAFEEEVKIARAALQAKRDAAEAKAKAQADLLSAARAVVEASDDTGCSDDLTVTSAQAVEALRKALEAAA